MFSNRLEEHLKTLCDEYPEYQNLYATWNLNKKSCAEALKNVLINYPHYSMHDASHADAVISKIEMLLGERVRFLSPTDTWLLLHAAYAHDLGMVISWKQISEAWNSQEFMSHINYLLDSDDDDLRKAAAFIKKHDFSDFKVNTEAILTVHKYVTIINASFFRGKHAILSRKYLTQEIDDFDIDLGHNNMIQPRLICLLSKICELHTKHVEKVLELDYITNGFRSDYAHPRFIAMMLRLGDLLDIDNGRFNEFSIQTTGSLPASSVPHYDKHQATTHLLVTPDIIEFSCDCPSTESYLEARNFVSWVNNEIDYLTKYWANIVPENFNGYAPRFKEGSLLINGVPDINGIAGLKFEISQSKAFQIIEGSNIYEDKFAFIRELIQNALDATKLQIWRDIKSGIYYAWGLHNVTEVIQPYDINAEIYKNYPIRVTLSTLPNSKTQVEISDRGTGISIESFKKMCNVGVSNSGSADLMEEINTMPIWLRPTAGFGIGLQSIFLLTDKFQIETCTATQAYRAEVYSHKEGGYLRVSPIKKAVPIRGTTIRLSFDMPGKYSYSIFGETIKYFSSEFDPMSLENHIGEARMLEAIRKYYNGSFFPLSVKCMEKSLISIENDSHFPLKGEAKAEWEERNQYFIKLDPSFSKISIWDRQNASYANFQILQQNRYKLKYCFKGIEINNNTPNFLWDGLFATIDLYGADTKECITLNRDSFTQKGYEKAANIAQSMLNEYLETVLENLRKPDAEVPSSFSLFTFWCLCDINQREKLPSSLIETITDQATVFERRNNVYEISNRTIKDLISTWEKLYFCNSHNFESNRPGIRTDFESIKEALEQLPDDQKTDAELIVAEDKLVQVSHQYYIERMNIFKNRGKTLILYKLSKNKKIGVKVDENTKRMLILALGQKLDGVSYYTFDPSESKRYAIISISDYEELTVANIPYGISAANFRGTYYIISPFSRDELDKLQGLSKDAFVDLVVNSPKFNNIIKYIEENSAREEKPQKETIVQKYKELISEYYEIRTKQ